MRAAAYDKTNSLNQCDLKLPFIPHKQYLATRNIFYNCMPQQPIAAIRGTCKKQSRNNALPARVPYNNSQVTARRLASCTRKYNGTRKNCHATTLPSPVENANKTRNNTLPSLVVHVSHSRNNTLASSVVHAKQSRNNMLPSLVVHAKQPRNNTLPSPVVHANSHATTRCLHRWCKQNSRATTRYLHRW